MRIYVFNNRYYLYKSLTDINSVVMLVLQETPAGFALFQVDDATVKAAEEKVRDSLWHQNFIII